MGCNCSAETDESTCGFPGGAITIKHCGIFCKKKLPEEEQKAPKTPEELEEIKSRNEYNLWMYQQRQEGKLRGIVHPKDQ